MQIEFTDKEIESLINAVSNARIFCGEQAKKDELNTEFFKIEHETLLGIEEKIMTYMEKEIGNN